MTRWIDAPQVEIPQSLLDLGLPPLIAQTLLRRGIRTRREAESFLDPSHTAPIPYPGIEPARERIFESIRRGEMICVWGDFDVDGQTSTAVLVQTLRALDANVVYYIPIRGKENHGVHIESLQPILDRGVKLVVTCDTGITAQAAIDFANSRGVDVIVTDHHDLGETLPNATAIVNPKLLRKDHPLANLAGVGVAYKLAESLLSHSHPVRAASPSGRDGLTPDTLLDLVALGLVADVAVLRGETRSLVQRGIEKLRTTTRLGLKAMAELSSTSLESLTEETIGFTFAPRLNALGRLSDANPAVELLLTRDASRAAVLAAQIEGLNAQRRLLTSQVYAGVLAQLNEHPKLLDEPVLVLSHRDWPGGVVGIVANRLVDRYHKPAILLQESDDGILRGSARSVEGIHITEAIASQKEILLGYGGHPMAAGLALRAEQLEDFRKALARAVTAQSGAAVLEEPEFEIDVWLGLQELNLPLAESLEVLAPFGAGNPALRFATRGVILRSVAAIGKAAEHLRLNVEDNAGSIQSFLWWNGAAEPRPHDDDRFDIAYTLRASQFRGERRVTAQFEDFRFLEQRAVKVERPAFEIEDLRMTPQALQHVSTKAQVWAEGADKDLGTPRFELAAADELVIYTAPPSPTELRATLEVVHPKRIVLIAVAPREEKGDEFLTRLAGLCKFAIAQRGGEAKLEALIAAMAARAAAVQIGLEWLGASGQLEVQTDGGLVHLSAFRSDPNPYLQAELFVALKGILIETAAYRKYVAQASADSLFY